MKFDQAELTFKPAALPAIPGVTRQNATWLVEQLRGKDWKTARELCELIDWPFTENNRRFFRSCAELSEGQIAGGQKGYKLIKDMTAEEYAHWRNWMNHQSDLMKRRIIESDKVFFGSMKKVEAPV